MSIHRRAAKRDANEPAIIEALRRAGAVVYPISGKDVPDLLVIYRGVVDIIEVKTKTGKLTDGQREYHRMALEAGYYIPVVRNPEEALRAIGAI